MPTAVERLLDSFLKFNTVEQIKLDEALHKIDGVIVPLADFNVLGLSFLKFEHDLKLQQTFNAVGGAFVELGSDFHKVETAEKLTDNFVVKLLGDHKIGDLLPAIQTHFKTVEQSMDALSTDLKNVGLDFIKLDSSPSPEVFVHKLAALDNDLNLGGDIFAAYDAFHKLSNDFKILGGGGSGDFELKTELSPLDQAYLDFGGALGTIGAQFLKLDEALAGGGGGAGNEGATLLLLYQTFHALGDSFNTLGGATNELIGFLSQEHKIDSGPQTIVGDVTNHGGGHGSD